MQKLITIAVDAMGGDGSPKKVIDGIIHHSKNKNNIFYKIFGDKNNIENFIPPSFNKNLYEIFHTNDVVEGKDTPLGAAKRGKNTTI